MLLSQVHHLKSLRCRLPRSSPSFAAATRQSATRTAPKMTSAASFSTLINSTPGSIFLGSSSSTRRQLMDELSVEHSFSYSVLTADIDEKAIRMPQPYDLVVKLAHAKADAIMAKLRSAAAAPASGWLLTCDQVVVHEARILEKPENAQEAREFIAGYGRAPASTVGSVVCTDLATGRRWEAVDVACIHFLPIPEATAEALIAEGEVMWCAGGLMVEHELVQPYITKMEGGVDSVMGLCKDTVVRLLTQAIEEGKAVEGR